MQKNTTVGRNFIFHLAVPLMKIHCKDIETEVVDKVSYDINSNKKYIIHCGHKGNLKKKKLP